MDPDQTAGALLIAAFVIGFTHTLIGPDHYLPFVALGKARQWSQSKVLAVTFICGLGHVLGSVVIGSVGVLAGWSLSSLEAFEGSRGHIAAWLMIGMGLLYLAWAIKSFSRQKTHTHVHVHADGTVHNHEHRHADAHLHPHASGKKSITFWSLFVIFVFGPCEALIPLLLFPSMEHNLFLASLVVLVFALATLATMLFMVWSLFRGVAFVRLNGLERYGHVAAGLTVLGCGTLIQLGF